MTNHTKEFLISILYLFVWFGIIVMVLGVGFAIIDDKDFKWITWILDWICIGFYSTILYQITEWRSK